MCNICFADVTDLKEAVRIDEHDNYIVEAEQENLILDQPDDEWDSVQFFFRLTEEHSLTHNSVGSLCNSVQWFVHDLCARISY